MSRNLTRTDCACCHGEVRLLEKERPITVADCGVYYDEYAGMLVANAECVDCEAKYLAWCDESTRAAHPWNRRRDERPFVDLSYRSSFNDEPGHEDLPRWRIRETTTRERIGTADPSRYWDNLEIVRGTR